MRAKKRGAQAGKHVTPRYQSRTLWEIRSMVTLDERGRKEFAVVTTACLIGVLALYIGAFITVSGW